MSLTETTLLKKKIASAPDGKKTINKKKSKESDDGDKDKANRKVYDEVLASLPLLSVANLSKADISIKSHKRK